MPSNGMRRPTRVLVVKRGDGARVLRYGRRLWPDSAGKTPFDDDKMFQKVQESRIEANDYHKLENSQENVLERSFRIMKIEKEDEAPESMLEVSNNLEARRFGLVYRRKRKSRSSENYREDDDRKYRKHFVRRQRRQMVEFVELEEDLSIERRTLSSVNENSRFAGILASILIYLSRSRHEVRLPELSSFLLSQPLREVLDSYGIQFFKNSASNLSGTCKIFGVRRKVPMFSVNFAAIPNCFLHIHMNIVLGFERLPLPVSCLQPPPDREEEEFERTNMKNPNAEFRLSRRNSRRKNGFKSRALRSRRRRRCALIFGNSSPSELPMSSRRSATRKLASSVDADSPSLDSASCSANLLISSPEKCFRESAVEVTMELSSSNQWILAVKRGGSLRYSYLPEKVVRSSSSNRFTHAVIWSGDCNWKLEFCDQRDWILFKELHQECCDRNLRASSRKSIPVPEVREVEDEYGQTASSAFFRPEGYLSFYEDELSRAMAKRSPNYDMDSEDEAWLKSFNDSAENSVLLDEAFEMIIDAFEKAVFCSPDYCSDASAAVDLCVDLCRKEVVQAVYGHWMKKRAEKKAALVRIFQCNLPKNSAAISRPLLKKRRSFKRGGRGKQRRALQGLCKS